MSVRNWFYNHKKAIKLVLNNNAFCFVKFNLSTDEQDMNEATDIVINPDGNTIALRIRKPEDIKFHDFTVRSYNDGYKTEIDKIKEGFCKWYLYAWSDGKGGFQDWMLIDLDKVREQNLLDDREEIPNLDGKTRFIAISKEELGEKGCIISWYEAKAIQLAKLTQK